MRRLLLFAAAAALVTMACSSEKVSIVTTTFASGTPSTTQPTDRTTPENATRSFYDHLKAGDCAALRADLTAAELGDLTTKAGGEEKLCLGFKAAAERVVSTTELRGLAKKSEKATESVVTIELRDVVGNRSERFDISLVKEGTEWKVRQFF